MKESNKGMESDKSTKESSGSRIVELRETFSTLTEISRILNTGLDNESLAICVRLCDQGANPEALATVIKELRRETAALKESENESN
uniref:Mitotic-spindle organizing protein 1 n=1 Tax=Acartia pacifica TaxID=335913 RepID=A0A0U2IG51_ACAPC|nr:mitotic-spindle organizing protein 1 [Acartia pacifica]ALS04308.1 mitotic-spindle organizing protein 1 [Acartia pacifica]